MNDHIALIKNLDYFHDGRIINIESIDNNLLFSMERHCYVLNGIKIILFYLTLIVLNVNFI